MPQPPFLYNPKKDATYYEKMISVVGQKFFEVVRMEEFMRKISKLEESLIWQLCKQQVKQFSRIQLECPLS